MKLKLHTKQTSEDEVPQHPKYPEAQAELQRQNGLVSSLMFKHCRLV
jgi:hypothetical protein